MHAIGGAPRPLVVLGLLAAIGVAGCTASLAPHPAASVLNQPASRGTPAPSSQPAVTPTATTTAGGVVRNLTLSTVVRSQLMAAFAAAHDIPQSYVTGTAPGTVYYAYVSATDTYWALANFEVSATALQKEPAGFQDGGDTGVFKKVGTGGWQGGLGGVPPTCGEVRFFPKAVLAAWSLPTSPPAGMTC